MDDHTQTRFRPWQRWIIDATRKYGIWRVSLLSGPLVAPISALLSYTLFYLIRGNLHSQTLPGWLFPVLIPIVVVPIQFYLFATTLQTADLLRKEAIDAELQMRHLANHDPLTDLLNRRGFFSEVAVAINPGMLLVIADGDDFKSVNDVHGHAVGDVVLQHFAGRLRDTVGPHAIIGRIGGDEFIALCAPPPGTDPVDFKSHIVNSTLVGGQGSQIYIRWSIGVTIIELDDTIDAALARADHEMYIKKRSRPDQPRTQMR